MKERPISFSDPMVKVIVDGDKTQTRRVVKLLPDKRYPDRYDTSAISQIIPHDDEHPGQWVPIIPAGEWPTPIVCPHGVPGDQLWIREAWRPVNPRFKDSPIKDLRPSDKIVYRATDPGNHRWRPSRYIPRWAARIDLEITGVRVERVQDISTDDAFAEGIEKYQGVKPGDHDGMAEWDPARSFEQLWDSLNDKRGFGWETNCWVWVLDFRMVT